MSPGLLSHGLVHFSSRRLTGSCMTRESQAKLEGCEFHLLSHLLNFFDFLEPSSSSKMSILCASPDQGKNSLNWMGFVGTFLVRNCEPCILPSSFLPSSCHFQAACSLLASCHWAREGGTVNMRVLVIGYHFHHRWVVHLKNSLAQLEMHQIPPCWDHSDEKHPDPGYWTLVAGIHNQARV